MIDSMLRKLIRRLVTIYFKRTRFLVYAFGIDESTTIYVLSEEVFDEYTRYGISEIKHTDERGEAE